MSLNTIGILYGTDKSSLLHNYLYQYEKLLGHLKDDVFNLIEIGIANGASLSVWEAYFARANVIGIDIEPTCRQFAGGRIAVEIGSQDDPDFLVQVATRYPPKVVIDDGSHRPEHQISSFECLFQALEPGGCYIVEDLTSRPSLQHNGLSPISYFSAIQKGLMTAWESFDDDVSPHWIPTDVARLDLLPQALVVWKAVPVDIETDLRWIEDLVRRSEKSESWLYYSQYLERRLGSLDRALAAAERGAEMTPNFPWSHVRIAQILERMGDVDRAVEAARTAFDLRPDSDLFEQLYRRLLDASSQQ